jgi:3-hydroxyisobutyrate dehydrogenase
VTTISVGSQTVGFIGAGKMGLPMIEHIVRAGYRVVAFDPVPANLAAAQAAGAEAAADATVCIGAADALLSSLPNDDAFAAVARQVAGARKRGLVYADTSTVSPVVSAAAAGTLADAGIAFVRATVSGNPVVALAASLTVMASGPQEAYAFVKPLFATFGKTHFHLGGGEEARVIKLVINLMIAGTAGIMGEALALGEKGGLDWAQMLDIMGGSAVGSPMVNYKVPPLKKRDYASTFSGMQMIKDLDLILGEAAAVGMPATYAALTRQIYGAIAARGEGELDYISTVRYMERQGGITHD